VGNLLFALVGFGCYECVISVPKFLRPYSNFRLQKFVIGLDENLQLRVAYCFSCLGAFFDILGSKYFIVGDLLPCIIEKCSRKVFATSSSLGT
jgi:hypothetical protein